MEGWLLKTRYTSWCLCLLENRTSQSTICHLITLFRITQNTGSHCVLYKNPFIWGDDRSKVGDRLILKQTYGAILRRDCFVLNRAVVLPRRLCLFSATTMVTFSTLSKRFFNNLQRFNLVGSGFKIRIAKENANLYFSGQSAF